MSIDYKHTVRVDREARFIRFYCWLWVASPQDINVCKLFWAYVFLPVGLILRLVILPIAHVIERTANGLYDRRTHRLAAPDPPVATEGPSQMQWALDRISRFFSRVAFRVGAVVYWLTKHKRLNLVVGRVLLGLAVLIGLAAIGVAAYFAVKFFDTTVIVLIVLGAVVLTVAILALLYAVGFLEAVWEKLLRPSGKGVGRGVGGFFHVMRAGFGAVKSNTCPQIEVVERRTP